MHEGHFSFALWEQPVLMYILRHVSGKSQKALHPKSVYRHQQYHQPKQGNTGGKDANVSWRLIVLYKQALGF